MENLDSLFLGIFCFLMGAALVGGVIALRGRALKRRAAGAPPEPDLVEVAQLYRSRKTHRLVVSLDNQTPHQCRRAERRPTQAAVQRGGGAENLADRTLPGCTSRGCASVTGHTGSPCPLPLKRCRGW